ncbi:phosphotransferase [Kribbella sp. NPDC051718]|uniref:aminoglycoside phosphotransferase family protein n=1 Tax=Kribbella sp. NPDC051718 TaxID=3155168 RepID=UPI003443C257
MTIHTHRIDVSGEVVTKTYVDWGRDEHLREWAALQVVHAAKPHLVPAPIRLVMPSSPMLQPSVAMSRLPGQPLGGPLTAEQLSGLQVALGELWSIPPTGVEPIDFAAFIDRTRREIASWNASGIVAEAQLAAVDWMAGSAADELVKPLDPVIGHVDPNLANYLWDGTRLRIIDFEDAGQSDLAVELASLLEHIASRSTDWTDFLPHSRQTPTDSDPPGASTPPSGSPCSAPTAHQPTATHPAPQNYRPNVSSACSRSQVGSAGGSSVVANGRWVQWTSCQVLCFQPIFR